MDLLTFQDRFSDERDCYKHLKNLKWPDGFQCPDCGSNDHFEQWQRKLSECRECGRQVYWRQGTIFENSNLPLRKWFWAIYLITELKKSLSRLELSRRLDVSYKTATRMANLIQSVMGQADTSFFLSGELELDEADFHSKHSGTDRATKEGGQPVFVAVETEDAEGEDDDHDTRMIRAAMAVCESGDAPSIQTFVRRRVKPGSTLRTDGAPKYVGIPLGLYGRETTVLDSEDPQQARENAEKEFPWVHILISNAKRLLNGTYHSVSFERLQQYLNEFCFRLNNRWSSSLFDEFMKWTVEPDLALRARLSARSR